MTLETAFSEKELETQGLHFPLENPMLLLSYLVFIQQPWWYHWYWAPPCALTCLFTVHRNKCYRFYSPIQTATKHGMPCTVICLLYGCPPSLTRLGRWTNIPNFTEDSPVLLLNTCSVTQSPDAIFFLIDLYWSIIASQYCVSFCCTTKQISHMHIHVPLPQPFPSLPHKDPDRKSVV